MALLGLEPQLPDYKSHEGPGPHTLSWLMIHTQSLGSHTKAFYQWLAIQIKWSAMTIR